MIICEFLVKAGTVESYESWLPSLKSSKFLLAAGAADSLYEAPAFFFE